MSRKVAWPTAGITSPGLWLSADRMTWQRKPDEMSRKAFLDSVKWVVAADISTPQEARDEMREGLRMALGK